LEEIEDNKKNHTPLPEEAFKACGHKNHIQKIMASAIISRPVRSADGKRWERTGLVGIWRCVKVVARKKGVVSGYRERPAKRGKGTVREKVYSAKAGDLRELDACMDGEMYQEIMINKGVPAVQHYFRGVAPETPKKIKEDGAPGHGYNNHEWPPAPTATHRVLER
jgi:hypothetical protein